MPAPERFLYYDLLLAHVLASSDVQLVYIDTGCTYAAHWRLHIPGVAGPVLIKVPWWHARGHGSKCYLKNSGLWAQPTQSQCIICRLDCMNAQCCAHASELSHGAVMFNLPYLQVQSALPWVVRTSLQAQGGG